MPTSGRSALGRSWRALRRQVVATVLETRAWARELAEGWESLDVSPYRDFDDFVASLTARQRWKLTRAAREAAAAGIDPVERRLPLRQRLKATPLVAAHAWSLNPSRLFGALVVAVELTASVANPRTYAWFDAAGRMVALTSVVITGPTMNILVFAQRPGQRNWLWWHCVGGMVRLACEDEGVATVRMGLNYRELKRRSWGTRAERYSRAPAWRHRRGGHGGR